MKKIRIRCTGAKTEDYKKMIPFQENLKKLTDENKQKLKHEIITKGFSAPMLVWENKGKVYTMDGHQRCKVLEELEAEGYQIPPVPVVLIHPDDLKEAKTFLLGFVSQYGQVTETGLTGSTLMACEFMQRRCRTSELDEKYCDVIIERWEKHTGKKARLEK